MDKKGIEFNFAWIFAIIVGSAIIFLAVYASTNLVGNTRYETDTKTAAQLDVLLNPVESNLETGKLVRIEFPDETRVFNDCQADNEFGTQKIRTSTRSGIGKEWQAPGAAISSKNRYLFSEKMIEGKEIYLFAKPIELPYKVADMIIVYSKEYCFVNPTDDIKDEIKLLNLPKISINSSARYCSRDSIKVCFFSNDECDIKVDESSVIKESKKVYYEGDFVYGAIFSDTDLYECQLKRMMNRNSALAGLYSSKTEFLSLKGCSSNLGAELSSFSEILKRYESSSHLKTIFSISEEVKSSNDILSCKLF